MMVSAFHFPFRRRGFRRKPVSLADDRGAVTVEAAIALCALVAMFGLLLVGVVTVVDQMKCADAAREAARVVARGQSELADGVVTKLAPSGARLVIHREGDEITARVTVQHSMISVSADAYALLEVGEKVGEKIPE